MSRRLIIGPKAALEALYAKVDATLVASLGPPQDVGGGEHVEVPPPTEAYARVESDYTGAIWAYPVDDYSQDTALAAIAAAGAGSPVGDLPNPVDEPIDWRGDPAAPPPR